MFSDSDKKGSLAKNNMLIAVILPKSEPEVEFQYGGCLFLYQP